MKRRAFQLVPLFLLIVTALQLTPVFAQSEVYTVNDIEPIDMIVFVPCANGGIGENVSMSGSIHNIYHYVIEEGGIVHLKEHFQTQGVSGRGLTTGLKYVAAGDTQANFTVQVGFKYTYNYEFRVIGQGPGNNFVVHENRHLTVGADGTISADIDNFMVTCK